jgi:hypothetical protein
MDPQLIKGHFFMGQALIELNHYDDAMKHLQRGLFLFYRFVMLMLVTCPSSTSCQFPESFLSPAATHIPPFVAYNRHNQAA